MAGMGQHFTAFITTIADYLTCLIYFKVFSFVTCPDIMGNMIL